MSISEAEKIVQPRIQMKSSSKAKKGISLYLCVSSILFLIVLFLCANSYKILQYFDEMRSRLSIAYKTIDDYRNEKEEFGENWSRLEDKNIVLTKEVQALRKELEKNSRGSDSITKQLEELKKQLNELKKLNKELVDDNISLQNSLKMAAAVGIKPQNYSLSEKLDKRDGLLKGKYVGKFLGTAYTPSKEECGNDRGITNSGVPIVPGVTLAIDKKYWPYGTVFYIKGLGYAVAMDTGSGVKGKYRFDFSVLSKEFAKQLGTRKWDVYLVKLGNGNLEGIEL